MNRIRALGVSPTGMLLPSSAGTLSHTGCAMNSVGDLGSLRDVYHVSEDFYSRTQ